MLLVLAGCAGGGQPAHGATRLDGVAVVRFKPCDGQAIERLEVTDAGDGGEPVWSAELVDTERATVEVPIDVGVPGYRVRDRRPPGGLRPATDYRVRARSTNDEEWRGFTFRADELAEGRIEVATGVEDYQEWLAIDSCRTISVRALILAGVVGAAITGGVLLVLRGGLGRLARRYGRPE